MALFHQVNSMHFNIPVLNLQSDKIRLKLRYSLILPEYLNCESDRIGRSLEFPKNSNIVSNSPFQADGLQKVYTC